MVTKSTGTKRPKRLPLVYLLLANVLFITFVLWQYRVILRESAPEVNPGAGEAEKAARLDQIREMSGQLVHPLRLVNIGTPSRALFPLRDEISLMISNYKKTGQVDFVSVHCVMPKDSRWFEAGDHTRAFKAGSLMKVPIMMCYLKGADDKKQSLGKTLYFEKLHGSIPHQTYKGSVVEPGQSYPVSELLEYMIIESDNYATYLLGQRMELPVFQKIFTDLGLMKPALSNMDYAITAAEYARFFRVLHSATYLSEASSDFGLGLLTQTNYLKGIKKYLPGVEVAHKFGEAVNGNLQVLSEAGIVYRGDDPFILTVMTEGTDLEVQGDLIGRIAEAVYRFR